MVGPDGDAHERSCLENRVSLRVCPDGAGAPRGNPRLPATRAGRSLPRWSRTRCPRSPPTCCAAPTPCARRRLAEEIDGGTRSDDPVNRARLREVFLEAVRNAHAELRGAGGHRLRRDRRRRSSPRSRRCSRRRRGGTSQLFGDRPVMLHDHGLDSPTDSPRRALRIGGWIDLTVVDDDRRQGAASVRPLVRAHPGRTDRARIDPARGAATLPLGRHRSAARRVGRPRARRPARGRARRDRHRRAARVVRRAHRRWCATAIAQPRAVNGPDCGQCNFVAGCPEHGDWHGRARGQWNDFRPSILRLSPSTLASWHRCPREWNERAARRARERLAGTHLPRRRDARAPEAAARRGLLPGRRVGVRRARAPRRRRERADARRSRASRRALPAGCRRHRPRDDARTLPVPARTSVHGECARSTRCGRYDDVLDAHDYKTGRAWDHRLSDDVQARVQAWVLAPLAHALGLRLRISFEYLSAEVTMQPAPFEPDAEDLDGDRGGVARHRGRHPRREGLRRRRRPRRLRVLPLPVDLPGFGGARASRSGPWSSRTPKTSSPRRSVGGDGHSRRPEPCPEQGAHALVGIHQAVPALRERAPVPQVVQHRRRVPALRAALRPRAGLLGRRARDQRGRDVGGVRAVLRRRARRSRSPTYPSPRCSRSSSR